MNDFVVIGLKTINANVCAVVSFVVLASARNHNNLMSCSRSIMLIILLQVIVTHLCCNVIQLIYLRLLINSIYNAALQLEDNRGL